jgi:hypothetical protein
MKVNEINAITAFIEILQKIKGVEYKIDSLPEEENRNTQDVEAILAPKDKNVQSPKIAVEHTIVEAHNNQILYVDQLSDIKKEIDRRCQGKLPTDRFFGLIVPPPLIVGTSKKDRKQFIEKMASWILDNAKNLNEDQNLPILYNKHTVSLQCLKNPYPEPNGKVFMMATRPEEAEKERRNRFHRSIEEKLPKLIKYKEKEEAFDTSLLLEDVSWSYCSSRYPWIDLIPNEYHSKFQLIDYVVAFISVEDKMSMGFVWKEKSQLYSTIPDNRRFVLRR